MYLDTQSKMTYHPLYNPYIPDTPTPVPSSRFTMCPCKRTWYQGDACDKKLTWAEKYYCRFCYKKARSEKVTILRALPYEVARLMLDRGDFCTARVSSKVWDF